MTLHANSDPQALFTYHLLQAEQARREYMKRNGREPELPLDIRQAWWIGNPKDGKSSAPIIVMSTPLDELL